ncbi:MAG: tRNA pseudouridine(38-40) synthase TruA [Oscillospiraceae bacterium]|jgi:tRNA pseudouridine38-40 synthase|nr:tRNA pseudouridine(38-40) synthase TruA [Oscillospiraceae bacterium]
MRNLLLSLKFKGTPFCGYQVQKNGVTVAEKLQNAIEAVTGVRSDIKGCSRTDSGVHANMYCANFKTESKIACGKMRDALNFHLPYEIVVYDCREAPLDFHARYHCSGKEYMYLFHNAPWRDPFVRNLALEFGYNMDISRINRAAAHFVGTHDFASLCGAAGGAKDTVRTVMRAEAIREGEFVKMFFAADGFLFNMVRIMVGTLIWVNQGRIEPDDIPGILDKKDRNRAGPTAPAHGLYLNRVFY